MSEPVEVKVLCPKCGSQHYTGNGVNGADKRTIYKKCRDCQHKGKVTRVFTSN